MKIILNSLDELKELAALINPSKGIVDSTTTIQFDNVSVKSEELVEAINESLTEDDAEVTVSVEADEGNDVAADSASTTEVCQSSDESTPAVTTAELDADGLPWDHRIHASTKTKVKDGTWKKKRGVDADTVASVTAELKQVMEAPTPEATPSPLDDLVTQAESETITFKDLLMRVSELRNSGKMSDDDFHKLPEQLGVPSFPSLNVRTDLLPKAMELVNSYA